MSRVVIVASTLPELRATAAAWGVPRVDGQKARQLRRAIAKAYRLAVRADEHTAWLKRRAAA